MPVTRMAAAGYRCWNVATQGMAPPDPDLDGSGAVPGLGDGGTGCVVGGAGRVDATGGTEALRNDAEVGAPGNVFLQVLT